METTSKTEPAVERVHAQLRSWLLDGTLSPGAMLSENDLSSRLAVSRTPVRGALRRLEAEGWLTIYPKRGALVRRLSFEEALAVADARQVLESAYVDAVSDEARAELCTRLDRMIDEEQDEARDGDYVKLVNRTIDFHRAFVEVGENPVLLQFYDHLRERQLVMTLQTPARVTGRWEEFTREHRNLVDLMRTGDRESFVTALRDHIVGTHGPVLGIRC
ncbi:putative transcriptional regulator, GntR family protein [Frondihabitans sucicola]|uniref:Transcriptional regulator, GntR family protein n=1 Tax=Frondihabitans sucicola TaxID=1268041 RepID=A0ABM8GR27_9MICO|nr:GntR family transcriptional regulator [Frondihabitans sucicola]BDZ50762.1 putative transcriptional regulator, GntR family protein [Frondihabitans sucicola]